MVNAANWFIEIMRDFKFLVLVFENPILAVVLAVLAVVVGLIIYGLTKRKAANEEP